MGMSTYVVGFQPADEQWDKMVASRKACLAAGVPVPTEVDNFLGEEPDDSPGREINIRCAESKWNDGNSRQGIEIDISKLPKNVKIIRFVNSW